LRPAPDSSRNSPRFVPTVRITRRAIRSPPAA
jgi:hypothetical protein